MRLDKGDGGRELRRLWPSEASEKCSSSPDVSIQISFADLSRDLSISTKLVSTRILKLDALFGWL